MVDAPFRGWDDPGQPPLPPDHLLGDLRRGLLGLHGAESAAEPEAVSGEPGTFAPPEPLPRPSRTLSETAVIAMSRLLVIAGHGRLADCKPATQHPGDIVEIVLPDGFVIGLPAGGVIVAGRDAKTCDLVVSHERASRRHLRVERTAVGLLVTDIGSSNGTAIRRLDATRILASEGPVTLLDGDVVEVAGGPEVFSVRVRHNRRTT